jgi:hypothetical protein
VITLLANDLLDHLMGLSPLAVAAPEALLLEALIESMAVGVHDDIVRVDRRDDEDGERDVGLWALGHRNTMWVLTACGRVSPADTWRFLAVSFAGSSGTAPELYSPVWLLEL